MQKISANKQLLPAIQFEFDLISNSGKKYALMSKQTQNGYLGFGVEMNEFKVVTTKLLNL